MDSAATAEFAAGLASAAVTELSAGYAELVAGFAASTDLRRLAASGGPDALLASDDPAITGLQKRNREFVTRAEQRAELVLGGGIDVVVERDLTLPDAAALLPVLDNAGIVVTDHAGAPVRFDAAARDGEYALLAAAPALHAEALAALRAGVAPARNRFVDRAGPHNGYAKKFAQ